MRFSSMPTSPLPAPKSITRNGPGFAWSFHTSSSSPTTRRGDWHPSSS